MCIHFTQLVANPHFGGISLKWNKWVSINDNLTEPIWSKRSEVVQRLLAQECELCGAHDNIEVHHIRQLADLKQKEGLLESCLIRKRSRAVWRGAVGKVLSETRKTRWLPTLQVFIWLKLVI
jgi:hypothetical protein